MTLVFTRQTMLTVVDDFCPALCHVVDLNAKIWVAL